MNAAIIWVIFPLVLSVVLVLIRGKYLAAGIIQTILSFALGISGFFIGVDQQNKIAYQLFFVDPLLNILGRSLVIDQSVKTICIVLYLFLGCWTMVSILFKIRSKIVPLGLTFVAFLVASLSVEPFLYSALFIEIAAIVGVIMVVDKNSNSKRGLLRFLISYSIGMPFILLAGWYLAGGEITPVNEAQLVQATILLGLGFVFWLGIFPFQSWIPLIIKENRLPQSMFLLILMPVVITVLLLKYLNGFVWLREYEVVFQSLRLFGVIMALTGSAWAFFQKRLDQITGDLLIISTGFMLLSAGVNGTSGFILLTFYIFSRLSIFFSITWALYFLSKENEEITLFSAESLFMGVKLHSIVLFISMFSFAGMPFTIGFPLNQSLLAFISAISPIFVGLLVLCVGLITIKFIRLGFVFLRIEKKINEVSLSFSEKAVMIILVALLIISGIFPNIFLSGFQGIVSSYEFLVK